MSIWVPPWSSIPPRPPTVWLDRQETYTHTHRMVEGYDISSHRQSRCKGASFPKLFQRTQNGNQNSCASFSRPEKKKNKEKNREKKSWGLESQLTVNKRPRLMQALTKRSCGFYFLSTEGQNFNDKALPTYSQQIRSTNHGIHTIIRFQHTKQPHSEIVKLISQPILFSKP